MNNSGFRNLHVAAAMTGLLLAAAVQAQVPVTTFHNDNARTGQNTQESVLTPANVNSQQFGKLFSVTMDGQVYAQPLYMPGVSFGGSIHNVVYVVTENDSVYAIDGDTGQLLKQVSLIPAGGSAGSFPCSDLTPVIGITGTPVIDPNSNTIYLITNVNAAGGTAQFLHALDITNLTEKFNGPVEIGATVAGTGAESNGSTVSFDAKQENQRPGLLLENNHVVIAWGSHCDYQPWHGWVMSYGAGSLAQEAVYNVSPNGTEGGIWMSGGGVATDGNGNIFVVTGNGDWNGTSDFGDSVLKLGPPANQTFPLLDYFTPWNQASLYTNDLDLSSGALVLLPPLPSGQALLAQQGKFGTIALLDENNLGKYCSTCSGSDSNAVQEVVNASAGIWGSPAYWNGTVYFAGNQGPIKAYSFNANGSGKLSTSPTSQTPQTFAFAAPTPVISANGSNNGILWAVDGSSNTSTCGSNNCLGLFAYDATNLSKLLYSSNQTANSSTGATVKFATPTVTNGKVYVGTQGALLGYGLLSTTPTAVMPGFSPNPGTYGTTQTVSLSDGTPGAVIYYTTNGQAPTTGSTQYVSTAPISVSTTTTIQAIAVASGYNNSAVASGTYTISTGGGGTGTPVSVGLSGSANLDGIVANGTAVPNGGIDGGGYAYSATLLGSSLTWSGSSFTLGASGTSNAVWGKTIALPAGSYSTIKLLGSGVNGAQANQTFVVTYTDGTSSSFTQNLSDWFYPQGNNGETSALTMAYRLNPSGTTGNGPCYLYGYAFTLNSAKTVASITLPNNRNVIIVAIDLVPASGGGTTPTAVMPGFSPNPGTYGTTQTVSLSDGTPGAVIYYTTNGQAPTTGSTQYVSTAPISVSTTTTIQAIAVASGYNNSAVASGTYTISTGGGGTGTPVSVGLSGSANLDGIVANGTAVPNGGIDGGGYAYSATLLGSSLTWSGSSFTLGASGTSNAVWGKTIALPAGSYSTIKLLGSGVNGAQANQTFVVTYTDGTSSSFTQNLSDWFYPQGNNGETSALTMAYRLNPSGTTGNGPCYLYGYAFTLNSAKTVASITLPNNRNVIIVAIDLVPASGGGTTPTAVMPGFSPNPGTYGTTQTVSLSDGTPGAVIYYTTNGQAPTTGSTQYVSTAPISVSTTTTIQAIAVASGYNNSAVASGTYTISTGGGGTGTPVSVGLSGSANLDGIVANGTAVPNGGIDGGGYAYSATLLGSSLTWSGSSFTLGASGTSNAVWGKTIALPAGSYSTIKLLGSGVNGAQANQTFVVTYTDGTSSSFTQNLSDWFYPQGNNGETSALTMAYRLNPSGTTGNGPCYLYGYAFTLNSAKTVASITLPNNRNVIIVAIDLSP